MGGSGERNEGMNRGRELLGSVENAVRSARELDEIRQQKSRKEIERWGEELGAEVPSPVQRNSPSRNG